MPESEHRQLAQWLNPSRQIDAPLDLGKFKEQLACQAINSRGWRLYLDYGDALFLPLRSPWIRPDQPYTNGLNAIVYLRLLQACEMDVLPPPVLVASLPLWGLPDERLDQVPPLYFRAAWKAAVASQYGQCSVADFTEEVASVSRWFFASRMYENAEPGLLKAGWTALLRRKNEWAMRQEPTTSTIGEFPGDEWNPYIRRVEWGSYRFEALTNAKQLREEGEAMQHCVGSYHNYCRAGARRIYSVRGRKNGKRMATLSLEYSADADGTLNWQCDQLSGLKNAEVLPPDMFLSADAVLRAYFDLPADAFTKPGPSAQATDEVEEEWDCDF